MSIKYKAYKQEDGQLLIVEEGSDLAIQLEENAESKELPGLERETSDDGSINESSLIEHTHPLSDDMEKLISGEEVELHKHKQIFSCATRVYGYSDERWVAASTLYGFNYILHNQSRGTGTIPAINWSDMGIVLPAGAKLKRLVVKGRGSSTQFTDMQVYVRAHDGDYKSGRAIDSSGETPVVEVIPPTPLSHTNGGPGNMGDMHMSEVSLEDYKMQNDGDVHIYFKPIGNLTGTRYWYINFFIEYTL